MGTKVGPRGSGVGPGGSEVGPGRSEVGPGGSEVGPGGSEVGPGGLRWAPETRRLGDLEKPALCGIIGHRPLRGRCPIDHYCKHKFMIDGAMGTAGHKMLVRLFNF